jgi:hypothetical protein
MRSIALITGLAGCLAAGLPPHAAWSQSAPQPVETIDVEPVGKVVTLTGSAKVDHATAVVVQAGLSIGGAQALKIDDPIYQNDVIETATDAELGIVFRDGTSFKMSKHARMEINEFIYDPKGASNSMLVRLTAGTFTFIAGKAADTGRMKVATPVGTMGIRGTVPHVEIMEDGKTVKFATLIEERKGRHAALESAPASKSGSAPLPSPAFERSKRLSDAVLRICNHC